MVLRAPVLAVLTVCGLAAWSAACGSDAAGPDNTLGGSVTIAPALDTLDLGVPTDMSVTLAATVRDGAGTVTNQVVGWTSSNGGVATVSNTGVVTAVTAGTTTISASAEGRTSGTATVVVISSPLHVRMFARFVALGSSTAAGFESGGIDLTTQGRSWPVLIAQQTQSAFMVPFLNAPGCPPPFTAPLGPPAAGAPCSGRVDAALTAVHNVAIPGERIADAVSTTTGALHGLMIGARTQLQAMRERNPTFVAIQLGDDDAAAAALDGVTTNPALTSTASFNTSVTQLVAELKTLPALTGAALLSVLDPTLSSPLLQPGAFYYLSRDAAGRFQGKLVNANCSPVTVLGQPNPLSQNLVSMRITASAAAEINCDPSTTPSVLATAEVTTIRNTVAQYNTALQNAATANGWAFVDINAVVQAWLTTKDSNNRYMMLRKCQDLPTATTPAQYQSAVLNSCPVTAAGFAAPNFFGSAISLDGINPSAAGAKAIANAVIGRVNQIYATSIVPSP